MILLRLHALPRWLRDIVPLVLWMALIFVLSSRSTLVEIENKTGEKFFFKTSHFVAYGMLAWLWWRALAPQRQLARSILLAAFVFTTLYGVFDEIHQSFVPGRHARIADMLFDASGALAMILLIRRVKWLRLFPDSWPLFPPEYERKSPQF